MNWTAAGAPRDSAGLLRAGAAAADLAAATRAALRHLSQRANLGLWVVSRVSGDDWTVVDCIGDVYSLQPDDRIPWASTLCMRMVAGLGPRVAPNVADDPSYSTAPMRTIMPVGAYIGVPLTYAGVVVGTLAGFHPTTRDESLALLLPEVEVLATLLATCLGQAIDSSAASQRADRAEMEAMADPLTHLGNRRAWQRVLADEEVRAARYGHSACILSIDLDGLKKANDSGGHQAGDLLLQRAAFVIRRTSRMSDHVARVGGDEFAVLAVESDQGSGLLLQQRLEEAFAAHGVEASVGVAYAPPGASLEAAWQQADSAMYDQKRGRRRQRVREALAGETSTRVEAPIQRTEVRLPITEYEGTGLTA